MQLIAILLITVSVLTFLSGVAIFLGSSKGERVRSAWFFLATIFATAWMVSISMFLIAPPEWQPIINWHVNWTYINGMFIDVALLGYIVWKQKFGKAVTIGFLILGIILTAIFVNDPSLLYTKVILSHTGNSLVTNIGPFYFIYIAFYGMLVPTVILSLFYQIIKSSSLKKRGGDLVLLIGFAVSGTMSLIFNLILPLWRWDFIWLGPLAISTTIIGFYYAILRYRSLNLSSIWLKILSYVVVMASSAVIYMVIFYIVFSAMFKGSTPSIEVIILNFIMILIVLLLLPATNELGMFIKSLISNQEIDLVYIVKKLSKISPKGFDLKELADFLAEHAHFEYVGFLIDGQIYGSEPKVFSEEGMRLLNKLGKPENGIWQKVDETNEAWNSLELSGVAAMRDGSGKTYGQIMFGKPAGRVSFSHRDLAQVETVVDLVSVMIDSKLKTRK